MKSLSIACLSLAALFVSVAPSSALDSADEKFVTSAADSGMAELKIAELGVQKASNADVKAMAETLVKDHTAIGNDLKALAGTKGKSLSASVSPEGAEHVRALEHFNGAEFDQKFLKILQDMHEASVKNFTNASQDAKDGEVKAFAAKHLPTIQAHLDHIKKLVK